MRTCLHLIAAVATVFAADDSWTKVKDLKSGTELRIVRDGAKQPLLAQMDHATDESLFIATKKEQLVVPKSEIQRLDSRPASGSRVSRQTTTKMNQVGNPSPSEQRVGGATAGPSSSTSSSVSFGSKPDFETIYRRIAGVPK